MASLKSNILINGINTLTSLLFPVITFPYAARVLLPEGIGAINFLNSIIGYIILLTSLGIPLYAVKEVAKHRNNKNDRDRITIEILLLSIVLCFFGYVLVWILSEYVPQIHKQSALFYVLSLSIVFTSIGVNWFYQAIEDFKFITIRAIIIRIVSAACLFLFVHQPSDLLIYGVIVVGSTVGNNIVNLLHIGKYVKFSSLKFKDLNIRKHIKPSLHVFILNLIISLYIQLNSVMLGLLSGEAEVGFFAAGTKISHIGLTIIGSLSTVLLPRCSHLLAVGDQQGFFVLINKSLKLTLALAFPITLGLIVLSEPITIVFCGDAYIKSIIVLVLNAPVVVFISLTNLMGIQILYPKDKTNLVIWSVTIGAICNVVLNLFLIKPYGALGAAISALFAEFAVLFVQLILGSKYYPFKLKDILDFKYFIASIIMAIILFFSNMLFNQYIYQIVFGFIFGAFVYISTLIVLKDKLTLELLAIINKKIKHEH